MSTPNIAWKEPMTASDVDMVPSTSQATASEHVTGDPRTLLVVRLLAAAALLLTAFIHARLAFQVGIAGSPVGRGQLFLAQAVASAIIAMAMISRNSRVWLFAVVLSGSGLLGILASVYFPIPSIGPFPAIDEPTWLLNKGVVALAEVTVIALWVIQQIAPPPPAGLPLRTPPVLASGSRWRPSLTRSRPTGVRGES